MLGVLGNEPVWRSERLGATACLFLLVSRATVTVVLGHAEGNAFNFVAACVPCTRRLLKWCSGESGERRIGSDHAGRVFNKLSWRCCAGVQRWVGLSVVMVSCVREPWPNSWLVAVVEVETPAEIACYLEKGIQSPMARGRST